MPPGEANVTVNIAPSYPRVCADTKGRDGKWYRKVSVFVLLANLEPMKAAFELDGQLWQREPAISHTLRFPAVEGRHEIRIWVYSGGETYQYIEKSLFVDLCSGSKSIGAYTF